MAYRADLIAVVEASYDVQATERAWLQGVANTFCDVLRPEHGLLAYQVDVGERGLRIQHPVQAGDPPINMVRQIEKMADLLRRAHRSDADLISRAQAKVYERVMRTGFTEPASHVLQSEFRRVGPKWMYTLGTPVDDVVALLNHHLDDNGMTGIFAGVEGKRTFRPSEREVLQMLSAHIKAGLRLRRRWGLAAARVEPPADGAVLTAAGELVHAEGDARAAESGRELKETAKRVDQARSKKRGRREEALAVWNGLVDGRWSLVEAFDSDGKRFMLAHRNPEQVRDPRGLSDMESRVVGLAVRGYSDKLVAYHLGIAEGTASSYLTHAMRKLGMRNRADLVRRLGRRYPQRKI